MLASAPKADIRLRRKIGRFRPQGDILQRDKDWSVRPPLMRLSAGGTSIGRSVANRRPPNWRPWPVCAWLPVTTDGYDAIDRALGTD
jgi:hypothetical protein